MGAVISTCGRYRWRLDRNVGLIGCVFGFFGINASTAGPVEEDHTTTKWQTFCVRNEGRAYIAGNICAYRTPDVRELARVDDPVGAENDFYLRQIIDEADVLVPCWGRRSKVPATLHFRMDALVDMLFASGKPVRIFGLTKSGDPLHPLMLPYSTPLVDWQR